MPAPIVGERYQSPATGNVFRVLSVTPERVEVTREGSPDRWDYGMSYWWVPALFGAMIRLA
jgi:hypothetical protein